MRAKVDDLCRERETLRKFVTSNGARLRSLTRKNLSFPSRIKIVFVYALRDCNFFRVDVRFSSTTGISGNKALGKASVA
jgi:hypothetical protein